MLFTQYLHNLHHVQAVKMIFSYLFLICTFKDNNLAENWTNFAENLKKLGSAEPVEPAFYNSDPRSSFLSQKFDLLKG